MDDLTNERSTSRRFAHDLVDLLFDHLDSIESRPVVEWEEIASLRDLVRLDAPPAAPIELAQLVARYSNQLHHPSYMGHQVCPPILDSVAADYLVSFLNNSVAVAEMSPIATAIEQEVIRWMSETAGYPETSAGTAVSGGSVANLTALMAARARWNGDSALSSKRPVIVAGADAHYSIARSAAILGIPDPDVLKVPSDDAFRMDVDALEETLAAVEAREDAAVLAIVATAGSTPTGAFDKLDEIALLRDRYRTWLHVDAAHGASALLSDSLRRLVTGIERADSLSWDPHKMMWMPLSLGTVLVRDGIWLRRAFEADAPYLFNAGADNLGQMTIQCSRRTDAIKLWMILRSRGVGAIVERIERVTALTRYLYDRLLEADDFEPAHEPDFNILCFRRLGLDDEQTAGLRDRLVRSGRAWITSTILRGERVLRVTMMNPETTEADVDAMLEALRAAQAS